MREKLLNMFKISIWNNIWNNIGDKLSKSQKHNLFCSVIFFENEFFGLK